MLLGDNYHRVSDTIDNFSTLIYALVALACVAGVIWLVRRDRRRRAARREA